MSSDHTGLGSSGQLVRRLAFGCEQLGGYEWGKVDPAEAAAAVELAVGEGITLFDTADCYGRGESERRLGRALAHHRDQVLIATKFGVRFSDAGRVFYDSSPQWAAAALDASLQRLATDRIDLLQMHHWDGVTPIAALLEALERMRERGKIRWYGISNMADLRVGPEAFPGLVSASLEYSLVERAHEGAARSFTAAGLSFLGYGTLGQGILSGKYDAAARFGAGDRRAHPRYRNFHGERRARNARIVAALAAHARELGASPGQLAIAWVLDRLPGSVALVGIKRSAQLRDALGALRLQLPQPTRQALDAISQPADATASPAP